ncbi:MAG TPA: HEAT repeat domain-containing protein [Blastocatellia bacterium]|nr:HEAT repeat domain-containing protein [Blastocatellia bacterium]
MPLIIIIVVVIGLVWWINSQRSMSLNERLYLKRRGYAVEEPVDPGPPVPKDTRLINLIESLGDLSPFARQRAAEDLSRMCQAGQRDSRMLPSLIVALNDSDASVRSTVAAALGNLSNMEAVEPLKQRLEIEESIHVRGALQKALQKLEANGLKS